MNVTPSVVGVDIAKRVFQVHEVNRVTGEIHRLQLKRSQFLEYFANHGRCVVGMEACGGAHHWARQLVAMGHTVKLLPPHQVRPFAMGNKNDVADAQAIWTAMQQPGMHTVAIKTESQQAVLALHRMREQCVKLRTAQVNALRGLLNEFGEVMPTGRLSAMKAIPEVLGRLQERLPSALIDTLREQHRRIHDLDEQVQAIEQRLKQYYDIEPECARIGAIPGIGLLTATAAVATMGDPMAFRSGRAFAAWLGLVPRQVGTGGKVKLLGISKRGDTYLRGLLIHGARAVLIHTKTPSTWLTQLRQRRPPNVVAVALANKMARTLWALMAHQRTYQKDYASSSPAWA
jgi:transposase